MKKTHKKNYIILLLILSLLFVIFIGRTLNAWGDEEAVAEGSATSVVEETVAKVHDSDLSETTEKSESTKNSGSTVDSGNIKNSGSTRDSESTKNSGSTVDSGSTKNSGSTRDSGSTKNSGSTVDSGSTKNSRSTRDSGSTENARSTVDSGSSENSGASEQEKSEYEKMVEYHNSTIMDENFDGLTELPTEYEVRGKENGEFVLTEDEQNTYLKVTPTAKGSVLYVTNNNFKKADSLLFECEVGYTTPGLTFWFWGFNGASASNGHTVLANIKDGTLLVQSEEILKMEAGKMYKISFVLNRDNKTYDLWIDEEQKKTGLILSTDKVWTDFEMRLWVEGVTQGVTGQDMIIDNVRVLGKTDEEIGTGIYVLQDYEDINSREDALAMVSGEGNSITFETENVNAVSNSYLKINRLNSTVNTCVQYRSLSESSYVVIEADLRMDNLGISKIQFAVTGKKASAINHNFDLFPASIESGKLILSNGAVAIDGFAPNQWKHVGFVLNLTLDTYDVYVDGALVAESVALEVDSNQVEDIDYIKVIRFYAEKGQTGTGDFLIDNLAIYDGNQPRDIDFDSYVEKTKLPENSSFSTDTYANNLIKGNTAIAPYDGYFFDGTNKIKSEQSFIVYDKEYLVPETVFEKVFNTTVVEEANGIAIGNNIKMTFDNSQINVGENEIEIPYAAVKIDGIIYIPFYAYAENATEKIITESVVGSVILSDTALTFDEAVKKEIDLYLTKARPTAEEIESLFTQSGESGTHPRIFATSEDFSRIKGLVESDATAKTFYDDIKATADTLVAEGVKESIYDFTTVPPVHADQHAAWNTLQNNVKALGLVYNITNEAKYAERLKDELFSIIIQNPDFESNSYLNMGEAAAAIGVGYDWIYNYLTPDERTTISTWATENILMRIREKYYTGTSGEGWWTKSDLNWNSIITNGEIVLALSVADEAGDVAFDAIEKSMRCGEYSLVTWAPDGGWYEGSHYADYVMRFMQYGLSSMRTALGTTYDRELSRGLKEGTYYQFVVDSLAGGSNNTGDATASHAAPVGLFYADLYNDKALANTIKHWNEILGTNFGGVNDLLYYRPELFEGEMETLPLDTYLSGEKTQMVTTREGWDNAEQMYASWAAGAVNSSHDHMDVGAFVYDVNGYRFACDLGPKNYVYSGDKYDYFRTRAESHNVMVINPDKSGQLGLQQPGQDVDGYCTISSLETGSGGVVSVIDMQDMYKNQTTSYLRGFMTDDNRRTLTIRDEITLKEADSELYWNMMTQGEITIVDEKTAYIRRNDQIVKLQFETNAEEFKLEKTKAEPYEFSPKPTDGLTDDAAYSRVLITMKASGEFYIVVKLSPMGEPAANTAISNESIAEWTAPTATSVNAVETKGYQLNSISVAGEPIADFKPETTVYAVAPGADGKFPAITATSANGEKVNVVDLGEIALIELYKEESSEYKKYYIVTQPEMIFNRQRYAVTDFYVSEDTSLSYPGKAMCDSDLTTKWYIGQKGSYLIQDLGSVKEIDAVAVAFDYTRNYHFDVWVSEDGENYTQVITDAQSNNVQGEYILYELNETVNARYVKCVSNGSDTSATGNIKEFAVLAPVQKEMITIKASTASKKYDGMPLTAEFTYEGTLVDGDILSAEVSGTITDVGSVTSEVTAHKVMRGTQEVTDQYDFAPYVDGTLTVEKRTLIMTSASESKAYDGVALTDNEVSISGDGFVEGEGATYSVTGSQTEVGSSENSFTYTLNEGTKAENYDITTLFGTLSVRSGNAALYDDAVSAHTTEIINQNFEGLTEFPTGFSVVNPNGYTGNTYGLTETNGKTDVQIKDPSQSGMNLRVTAGSLEKMESLLFECEVGYTTSGIQFWFWGFNGGSASNGNTQLAFIQNGALSAQNEKIMDLDAGKMYKISLVIHPADKTYDLYVNEEQKKTGLVLSADTVWTEFVMRLQVQQITEGATGQDVIIDNVKVLGKPVEISSAYEKAVLSHTKEILNQNFEGLTEFPTGFSVVNPNGYTGNTYGLTEVNGKTDVQIKDPSQSGMNLRVTSGSLENMESLLFECEVGYTTSGIQFCFWGFNGGSAANGNKQLAFIQNGVLSSQSENIMNLTAGEMYKISFVIYPENKTYDLYVNEEQKKTGLALSADTVWTEFVMRLQVQQITEGATGQDVIIDNVRVLGHEVR